MIHPHLDHIGIAVNSISAALAFYQDALGLAVGEREEIVTQKVRVQFLETGETRTELLEASSEDSAISRFIEKRGEGLHHIAYRVEDLEAAVAGEDIIYGPFNPGEFATVSFIIKQDVVSEYLQYSDTENWFDQPTPWQPA